MALNRCFHALLAFAGDFLLLLLAPIHPADEIGPQADYRLLLPALLYFLRRAITRCIVSRCVIAEPIGDGLDEPWPFSRPGRSDRRIDARAHGDDVVAVDLLSGKARRDAALLLVKAENLLLLGPFGGQVGEASNPHAMRQPPVDRRLDAVRCKESKRDRHIHFSDTAPLPPGRDLPVS